MKVLVANIWLKEPAGTECWCRAVADELTRQGHGVKVWTPHPGPFLERTGLVMAEPGEKFDLILDNHGVTKDLFKARGTIHTCHGVIFEERPMEGAVNVAVSETVANRWHLRYLIPNGIDTERLRPVTRPDKCLHKVLSMCKTETANVMLQKTCDMMGLELATTYGHEVFDIAAAINDNDIVVGVGRSLLDAMSCGRPVISFDDRPYYFTRYMGHGYLKREDFQYYTVDNFTGLAVGKSWNEYTLQDEFGKYDPADGGINREFIVNNLSIANTVNAYLALYYKEFIC